MTLYSKTKARFAWISKVTEKVRCPSFLKYQSPNRNLKSIIHMRTFCKGFSNRERVVKVDELIIII